MTLSASLRKAAVLISSLDDQAADALLQQLRPDDAAKIRSALVELDEIPQLEQQQVLAEFLRQQNGTAAGKPESADDVTLEVATPWAEETTSPPNHAPAAVSPPVVDTPSFAFLEGVDSHAIAALLSRELPQTVALVIAHLPPEKAASVLQDLPPALATEALERIAWIDEPAPEIQSDVIRSLRAQLAPHIRAAAADAASLAHLSAVLGAMDARRREHVVHQLGERNQDLLDRLDLDATPPKCQSLPDAVIAMRYRLDSASGRAEQPPIRPSKPASPAEDSLWLTFENLLQFSDEALRAVFAATDPEVVLLALTGAEPRLISRIVRRLQPREAATLRHRLEHPGPLRLRDVEQARFAVAAVASRLAHEGAIELPSSVRFAAAI